MLLGKKIVDYVSAIDRFIRKFDETHPLSASQRAEIKKYQRISQLRDHPTDQKESNQIWEEF
jgi:hypothetical protein